MTERSYNPRIDIIKAFAIISVVILHSLPLLVHYKIFSLFHVMQAVPIFYVLLGHNSGSSKRELCIKEYFFKQFRRIIMPFLFVFVVSVLIGFHKGSLDFGWLTLFGYLPYTGPGNYFVSVMLQFIFIFPLLNYGYKKNPWLVLFLSIILNVIFEFIAKHFEFSSYVYNASIFRSLSAIVLGLWIIGNYDIRKNYFMVCGSILSILYLLFVHLGSKSFSFIGTQNSLSYFYPALLVMLGLKYLPVYSGRIYKFLCMTGKASYHIFLTQIAWFMIAPLFPQKLQFTILAFNVVACLVLGCGFYWIDNKLRSKNGSAFI